MQIINDDKRGRSDYSDGLIAGLAIIIVGLMILGKNLGIINQSIFRIIISWQMLLIFIGTIQLLRHNHTSGAITMGIGLFFLIPKLTYLGNNWISVWWPLIIIAVGIVVVVKLLTPSSSRFRRNYDGNRFASEISYKTDNGFVDSDISFGSVNQIVIDPIFRGARIRNSFGSTVLDLRRTTLEEDNTYIDIDCNFGGIEIYVPSEWRVQVELKHFLGGTDDKRHQYREVNISDKRLILRGNISFGGVEIKS